MNVTSITYNIDGCVLTITHDSPGVVLAEYTSLDAEQAAAYHEINDMSSAYIASNKILGMHHGMVGAQADVAASTMGALTVTLEDMAEG